MKFAGDKAFRFSEGVTLSGFLSGCDCKRIAIPENSALSDAEGARRIFVPISQAKGRFILIIRF